MEITLTYRRKDFEEAYYVQDRGNYFKDESIKGTLKGLLLSFGFLIVSVIYSYILDNYDLFSLAIFITIVFSITYLSKLWILIKWKKQIKKYLDGQEIYSKHKLLISENYLSIFQDDNETILNWTNFNKSIITEDYIWLVGNENVLIPSKSMNKNEFTILRKFISEKLK